MRATAMGGVLALCACTSPVEQAEKQYEIVKKSGRAADICEQGRQLVAAYLQSSDGERYTEKRVATDIECEAAKGREELGIFRMPDGREVTIEADNMDADMTANP